MNRHCPIRRPASGFGRCYYHYVQKTNWRDFHSVSCLFALRKTLFNPQPAPASRPEQPLLPRFPFPLSTPNANKTHSPQLYGAL